jgi:hypothetical protein
MKVISLKDTRFAGAHNAGTLRRSDRWFHEINGDIGSWASFQSRAFE